MKDWLHDSSGPSNAQRSLQFVTTPVPQPFDGVGRALASAYPAVEQSVLPMDMVLLLQALGAEDDARG